MMITVIIHSTKLTVYLITAVTQHWCHLPKFPYLVVLDTHSCQTGVMGLIQTERNALVGSQTTVYSQENTQTQTDRQIHPHSTQPHLQTHTHTHTLTQKHTNTYTHTQTNTHTQTLYLSIFFSTTCPGWVNLKQAICVSNSAMRRRSCCIRVLSSISSFLL